MANPWDSDPVVGGNPWDADPVISKPKKNQFANVQTTVTNGGRNSFRAKPAKPPGQGATPEQVNAYLDRITGTNLDPTSIDARPREQTDVSAWDLIPAVNVARRINTQEKRNNLLAGIGKAFADVPHMARQAALQADVVKTGLEAAALNRIAPNAGNEWVRKFGLPAQDRLNEQYAVNADRAQIDAPLMSTGQGISGYITGSAAQFMGPGAALRGTAGARAFLPATIGGNAIQGGVLGWMQPAENPQQQMENARTGALLGGGLAAIPAAARKIRGLFTGNGLSGVEARAGKVLQDALGGRPLNIAPSQVPGVNRTLGDATRDAGVAALERNARRLNPEVFSQIDDANNAARVSALQQIAGDEATMARAVKAREAAAGPFYRAASEATVPVDQPLQEALTRVPARVIAKARGLAKMEGIDFGEAAQGISGQQLHYIKMAIDDALSRTGPGGLGNVERRALMGVKDELVSNMSRLIPEYAQGMQAYTAASPKISRMQVGQELMARTAANQTDALGNPIISPAKFASSTRPRMLDTITQKATGFNKAKAAQTLTPEQMQTLGAIRDDMQRQMFRQANAAQPGSATKEAIEISKKMARQEFLGKFGKVGRVANVAIDAFNNEGRKSVDYMVAQIIANPSEAQRILKSLSPKDRAQALSILSRLGGATGSKLTSNQKK